MRSAHALHDWLVARGGVAHTRVAAEAGFSKHLIATAVAHGQLERVRRSWLITTDCDPRRRAAAGVSGRVTCVSAAEMGGLWTPSHQDVHVAVPHSASRLDGTGLLLHRAVGPSPVSATMVGEPIFNVLFHVARCLPRVDALAVWDSAVRRGLVSAEELAAVRWRSTRADELSTAVSVLSDSGVETFFVALMRSHGVSVQQQVWVDGHPLDGLIGTRLAVQIDGFAHHSDARDRRRDIRADARLALRGFTTLRFDFHQVFFDSPYVVDTVLRAMAQGRHLPQ